MVPLFEIRKLSAAASLEVTAYIPIFCAAVVSSTDTRPAPLFSNLEFSEYTPILFLYTLSISID